MKSYRHELFFHLPTRRWFVNITSQVQEAINASKVREGLVLVNAMHISASVFINDHESGLFEDWERWLEKLAPRWPGYQHHHTGEDNADAHLKALLLHHETTLPVTNGGLDLGTWQRVFYAEFDGQRSKRMIVKVMGAVKS